MAFFYGLALIVFHTKMEAQRREAHKKNEHSSLIVEVSLHFSFIRTEKFNKFISKQIKLCAVQI